MLGADSSALREGICPAHPSFLHCYWGSFWDSPSPILDGRNEATLQMVEECGGGSVVCGLGGAGPPPQPWAAYLQASFM